MSGEPHTSKSHSFPQLDGWRGLSILLVLAAHLLPLGPARLQLNAAAGYAGMAIFFTLSGFLITTTLLERPDARTFFIRRFARILPLAYLFMLIALPVVHAEPSAWLAHLGFYANLHLSSLTRLTSHLWSLCVEMQFYVVIGCIVLLGGRRTMIAAIPILLLVATASRVYFGGYGTVETHQRVDEILSGATLALAYSGVLGGAIPAFVRRLPFPLIALVFLATCHERSGGLVNAARGYCASLMVGRTIMGTSPAVVRALSVGWLRYLAETSYALYVIHHFMVYGWMDSGSRTTVYLVKRPLGFAITFVLAHLSSYHFEKRWTNWARSITSRRPAQAKPPPTATEAGVAVNAPPPLNH